MSSWEANEKYWPVLRVTRHNKDTLESIMEDTMGRKGSKCIQG
jgi:hypothetical protein